MRMHDDLRTAIEPGANPDVQAPTARMLPGDPRQAVGFFGGRRKGKTGGSPRALTDAERAGAVEGVENGSDLATGEARAALCRGKIITEAYLQFFDRGAEPGKVMVGK